MISIRGMSVVGIGGFGRFAGRGTRRMSIGEVKENSREEVCRICMDICPSVASSAPFSSQSLELRDMLVAR